MLLKFFLKFFNSEGVFFKRLYEPKMDVILTIRFKITAEIEITKHMFCVLLCRRGRVSAF